MEYENFDDYALNDRKYLLAALSGKLFEPMDVITFKDGTGYGVSSFSGITSGCTRKWIKDGDLHREDGPAVVFNDGGTIYYLHGSWFITREAWAEAVVKMQATPLTKSARKP